MSEDTNMPLRDGSKKAAQKRMPTAAMREVLSYVKRIVSDLERGFTSHNPDLEVMEIYHGRLWQALPRMKKEMERLQAIKQTNG